MNKFVFILLFSLFSIGAFSQNKTIIDARTHKKILNGSLNTDAFKMDICREWYAPEHQSYKIKSRVLRQLKQQKFDDIKIQLVLGSWCHDSHVQVPRFIKILEAISFPSEQLEMNALDTYKHSSDFDAKANGVTRVPTIIIYKKGEELGRIVEHPNKSLEKDLLRILSHK